MAKKEKKIYKPQPTLAIKPSLNHRWTNWRQGETKNRQASAQNELRTLVLKALWKDNQFKNNRANLNLKIRLQWQMWDTNKRAAVSKTRNYCHYVGRSRGINRKLFMARHTLRKFARFGMLPGFVKERC